MKRPLLIVSAILGSALAVLGLGGWILWKQTDVAKASAELDQEMADAKAVGLPLVAADLAPQPPVRDAENAAPFIRHAMELIHGDPKIRRRLEDLAEAQRLNDGAGMGSALDGLQPLLRLARLAADKPGCDFHRDRDEGFWLLFPEFAEEKQLARVLGGQAVCEAARGDVGSAMKDLGRAAAIGRHAAAEPNLIGLLVGVSCDAFATRAGERIAERWHTDAVRLGMLREKMGHMGREPDFGHALNGESYLGIATLRNVLDVGSFLAKISGGEVGWLSSGEVRLRSPLLRSGAPPTPLGKALVCRWLQMWIVIRKDVAGISDPEEIGKHIDSVTVRERQMGGSHAANAAMMPVYSQAGVSIVQLRAARLCTGALAAVLQFKAQHGRYPKSLLEARVRDEDPFTGKPLKFRVDGAACRVYSVGPDRVDDGGIRREELPESSDRADGWDVVASYPAYVPRSK